MSEPRHYRNREAYRKAEAYRHIHHVPHGPHPPKTVYIGGRRTRVSPGADPPSWVPWVLLVVVVAVVLLTAAGLLSTALLRLTVPLLSPPPASPHGSGLLGQVVCERNCSSNSTNSTSGGGFFSGVTTQDIGGVVLLGLTVAGLGGAVYTWQGGGDRASYVDTGSNVASTGASVVGPRRSRDQSKGRSNRR